MTAQSLPAPAAPAPLAAVPATEQRREARRPVTMMRAAKVICQAGEYPCVIRDVSSGGVRLKMFHALPEETHVFLDGGDGEVHALIRVWVREMTAGFRFARPSDPDQFLARPAAGDTRAVRLSLSAEVRVSAAGKTSPARLRNLGQGGAHVDIEGCLPIGQTLVLAIPRVGERTGWVRWRRGTSHGVVFDVPRRLDQLAADALALQPLPKPGSGECVMLGEMRGAA